MEEKKVKIIFDTDIGEDVDDAGAMAVIHTLCDRGEAELLAVTHCYATPYVAGCIDAINTHRGRRVPIGINYAKYKNHPGTYAAQLCNEFPNGYPADVLDTPQAPPDTLAVLRKTLAEAEDGSVTLIVTGALCSMARLVLSEGDEISPLTGKELITRKLARTVVMGGRFFETWPMPVIIAEKNSSMPASWEWNLYCQPEDTRTALENWPGELVFSSFEIGYYIITMKNYSETGPREDPVRRAYELHSGVVGRNSWDQTAVLEAVRPGKYWNYHEQGKVVLDEQCISHWLPEEGGKHTYLLPKTDYEDIRKLIDTLSGNG